MKRCLLVIAVISIFFTASCAPKHTQPIQINKGKQEQISAEKKQDSKESDKKDSAESKQKKNKINKNKKQVKKQAKAAKKKKTVKPVKKASKPKKSTVAEGLVLIGQVEHVYVKDAKLKLSARIDTGATTSSINAKDIVKFERDGQKWVRFSIPVPGQGEPRIIEKPLVRKARIKRHGADSLKRLVVALQVYLGPINTKGEFSLTDRSEFKYPILIGRNVLIGKAAVDVSQKYLTSPMSE